jgi:hypothetical protein
MIKVSHLEIPPRLVRTLHVTTGPGLHKDVVTSKHVVLAHEHPLMGHGHWDEGRLLLQHLSRRLLQLNA